MQLSEEALNILLFSDITKKQSRFLLLLIS